MLTLKPLVSIPTTPLFTYKTLHHTCIHVYKSPLKFRLYAQNGGNESTKESSGGENRPVSSNGGDDGNGNGNGSKKERFAGFNFRWSDLLNPDQDNFVAIGLAGVLTLASLQVLSQLFLISFAILVAALKYSFIAALLIFILVTLL